MAFAIRANFNLSKCRGASYADVIKELDCFEKRRPRSVRNEIIHFRAFY